MKVSFVTMTKNKMFPLLDFGEENRQFLQRTDGQINKKSVIQIISPLKVHLFNTAVCVYTFS